MSLLTGLYTYEVALLVLGVAFFVILLAAFIRSVLRSQSYTALFPFFGLTVAMIGYPGIKSFQYKDGVVTIERITDQLQKDPANEDLRETLTEQVTEIADRPNSTPEALASIGTAQFALGDHEAARMNLDKALLASPTLPEVTKLQALITLDEKLTTLTEQAEQNPGDLAAGAELKRAATEVSQLPVASPVLLGKAARAEMIVGNKAAAESLADKVRRIGPKRLIAK